MTRPDEPPAAPPEAHLIRVARRARGNKSPETLTAPADVPIKAARWRHIEQGYSSRNKPVRAPAGTLAHMAHIVGVTPEQLVDANRADAAEVLREILRQEQAGASADASPIEPDMNDQYERDIWEFPDVSVDARRGLLKLWRDNQARRNNEDRRRSG